jgi:hypothetical protein
MLYDQVGACIVDDEPNKTKQDYIFQRVFFTIRGSTYFKHRNQVPFWSGEKRIGHSDNLKCKLIGGDSRLKEIFQESTGIFNF